MGIIKKEYKEKKSIVVDFFAYNRFLKVKSELCVRMGKTVGSIECLNQLVDLWEDKKTEEATTNGNTGTN